MDTRSREVGELVSRIDPAKYVAEIARDHVLVKKVGKSLRLFIHSVEELREFCDLYGGPGATTGKQSSGPKETLKRPVSIEEEIRELRSTVADLRAKGKRVVGERDKLEQRVKDLETQLRTGRPGSGKLDDKFALAKRAFAKLYHPNNRSAGGIEALVRAEIFKEFWAELERIERDTPG